MNSSLLRQTLIVLFTILTSCTIGQGQILEEPEKQQEFIEDPFAEIGGKPIPLTQETEDPFGPPVNSTPPVEKPEIKNPFEGVEKRPEKEPEILAPNTSDLMEVKEKPLQPETTQPLESKDAEPLIEQELPAKKSFEDKFWEYLKSNAYENWAPVPGQSDDFYPGESPHGAFLKMYLNRTAAGSSNDLPNGSIIVKENYAAADPSTLKAITVMYRSQTYNPEAGDWYWIKYNPDGSVAKTSDELGAQKIFGKANGCINCHRGAEGNDFTFFNDK